MVAVVGGRVFFGVGGGELSVERFFVFFVFRRGVFLFFLVL